MAFRVCTRDRQPRSRAGGPWLLLQTAAQVVAWGVRGGILRAAAAVSNADMAPAALLPRHRHVLSLRHHDRCVSRLSVLVSVDGTATGRHALRRFPECGRTGRRSWRGHLSIRATVALRPGGTRATLARVRAQVGVLAGL